MQEHGLVAGSHDPLLEWAVRESRCGMAMLCHGSEDGLQRVGAVGVQTSQDAIAAVVGQLDPADGPVWVKALSNLAAGSLRHPDHVASGQAAVNLLGVPYAFWSLAVFAVIEAIALRLLLSSQRGQ